MHRNNFSDASENQSRRRNLPQNFQDWNAQNFHAGGDFPQAQPTHHRLFCVLGSHDTGSSAAVATPAGGVKILKPS
eukprot:1004076-Rhodomonas_salina.3